MGDRSSGIARRPYYGDTDEEDSDGESTSSEADDDYDEDLTLMSPREREAYIVQAALMRIERARASGRDDVSLTEEELAALRREQIREAERREEAERKKRGSGSGSDRKKRKEQRVAVPLTHLEPVSRKKKSAPEPVEDRQVYPPMGYFPPPSASGSRTRPRSGTSLSQRPPSRAQDNSSPFQYDYVQRPASASANRHVSEPSSRPRSSRSHRFDDSRHPSPSSSQQLNPFQFQTAGPRAPHSSGAAAASRRHVSGPAEPAYTSRRGAAPAAARSRRGSRRPSPDETSEDQAETSEESTSDDLGNGAQIREPHRGRDIIVEVSPEREPPPSKKKSSGSSPVKRKPVPSERGGGRRKRK